MVALALIGVGEGEFGNGLVEGVRLAHVTRDFDRFAGTGVGASERASTEFGVLEHETVTEDCHNARNLHVLKLANVEVPAEAALRPTEEKVAGRLHELAADDDTLAMVRVPTLARIGSKTKARASCFNLDEVMRKLTPQQ